MSLIREERKLKEEEKRKREDKTDDTVPVLGQVGIRLGRGRHGQSKGRQG